MATVANEEACFGSDCEKKQSCLRHAVLRGDVPCFPVADHLCHTTTDDAFVQWDGSRAAAVPALFR